jgi:hypothetical protein
LGDTSPFGSHAALQLFLRAKCLKYSGTVLDLVDVERQSLCTDYDLDEESLDKINASSERQMEGAMPSPDIFQRVIVRYQTNASSFCADPRVYPNGRFAMNALQLQLNKKCHFSHHNNLLFQSYSNGCC